MITEIKHYGSLSHMEHVSTTRHLSVSTINAKIFWKLELMEQA